MLPADARRSRELPLRDCPLRTSALEINSAAEAIRGTMRSVVRPKKLRHPSTTRGAFFETLPLYLIKVFEVVRDRSGVAKCVEYMSEVDLFTLR